MMPSIDYPYDENQFINQLQAYNTWKGNDELLDLMREIQSSKNYYWQGLCFPDSSYLPNSFAGAGNGVAGGGTLSGTLVIPVGTYVTSITHYSSQSDGFRFKLYDKGTKASIFYGDYSYEKPVSSNMMTGGIYATTPSDAGSNSDIPFGPGYLMSPFIVTKPGVLGWEIVNESSSVNVIQVMLACAVPINQKSVGQIVVAKN
jgi:hypothetical protein